MNGMQIRQVALHSICHVSPEAEEDLADVAVYYNCIEECMLKYGCMHSNLRCMYRAGFMGVSKSTDFHSRDGRWGKANQSHYRIILSYVVATTKTTCGIMQLLSMTALTTLKHGGIYLRSGDQIITSLLLCFWTKDYSEVDLNLVYNDGGKIAYHLNGIQVHACVWVDNY